MITEIRQATNVLMADTGIASLAILRSDSKFHRLALEEIHCCEKLINKSLLTEENIQFQT
jgi:hypothetical protein